MIGCLGFGPWNAPAADDAPGDAERRATLPIASLSRTDPIDFEKEVLPIFRSSCLACHNHTTAKAELILETPQTILKGSEHGPVIVPGNASKSVLFQVAAHARKPRMPPPDNKVNAANLTPHELALLKLWIDQGAKGEVRAPPPIRWQRLPTGLHPIYAVAVSRDGQFAACGRANQIFVYHLPSGQLVTRLTDPALLQEGLYDHPGVAQRDLVHALAFHPDGSLLASGDYRAVKLWRRGPLQQKVKLEAPRAGPVESLAASPDGRWLATGHLDGRVHLWETGTGKLAAEWQAHPAAVRALDFSPDGARLCSVSAEQLLRVWSVAARELQAEANLPAPANALAWLGAGKLIATGGADGVIRVWAMPETNGLARAPVKEWQAHEGPVTALNAPRQGPAQLLSGGADGFVRLWNLEAGESIRQLDHGAPVTAVAMHPDGQRLAAAGLNHVARLWHAESGAVIAELRGDRHARELVAERERDVKFARSEVAYHRSALEQAEGTHKEELDRVAKATDGKAAAQKRLAEKAKAREAKAAAERELADWTTELQRAAAAHEAAHGTASQAETEAKAAAARAEEALRNLERARLLRAELEKAAAEFLAATNPPGADRAAGQGTTSTPPLANLESVADRLIANAAALAAMAKEFAERLATEVPAKHQAAAAAKAAADKLLAEAPHREKLAREKIVAASRALETAEREFQQAESAAAVAEDLFRSAQDNAKKAADEILIARAALAASETAVNHAEAALTAARTRATDQEQPIRALAFSPDGITLATAGDNHKVHTWSATTGAAFDTLPMQGGSVRALAFLGNHVLVSSTTRSAVVWDLARPWNLERVLGTGGHDSPISDRVNALAFTPDGTRLATGSGGPSRAGEIKLWHVDSGDLAAEIANPHSDAVLALDFSADGRFLASGAADRFAKVFEWASGRLVRSFEGHTHHVLGVSWQRNGRVLATAGADKVIKVWDLLTGQQRKTITGFGKEITSIRFIDAGNVALVTSGDTQVRLVRDDGKNDVRVFGGANDFVQSAAMTPDGTLIVGGGQDGVLRVWDGATGNLVQTFEPPKPDEAQNQTRQATAKP